MAKQQITPNGDIEGRVIALLKKKFQLEKMLWFVEDELQRLTYVRRMSGEVSTSPADPEPTTEELVGMVGSDLPFVVHDILVSKPMSLKGLVDEVCRSGYKHGQKNLASALQDVIQRLRTAQAVHKDDAAKSYKGVRMSKSVLAQRLSQQEPPKRRGRPRKTAAK